VDPVVPGVIYVATVNRDLCRGGVASGGSSWGAISPTNLNLHIEAKWVAMTDDHLISL
jgi:hypothetical protein